MHFEKHELTIDTKKKKALSYSTRSGINAAWLHDVVPVIVPIKKCM